MGDFLSPLWSGIQGIGSSIGSGISSAGSWIGDTASSGWDWMTGASNGLSNAAAAGLDPTQVGFDISTAGGGAFNNGGMSGFDMMGGLLGGVTSLYGLYNQSKMNDLVADQARQGMMMAKANFGAQRDQLTAGMYDKQLRRNIENGMPTAQAEAAAQKYVDERGVKKLSSYA